MTTDPTSSGPVAALLSPARLFTRAEALAERGAVLRGAGLVAWYLRNLPPDVPLTGCRRSGEFAFVRTSAAPSGPPRAGDGLRRRRLSDRIHRDFRSDAADSPFRLVLGCLLAAELGIHLRRVDGGRKLTFAGGESRLSAWMVENARIVWVAHPEPWLLEQELLRRTSLPLNLDRNEAHPYHPRLARIVRRIREAALSLPVAG